MLELIISSIYFILPAYVANTGPVIFGKLKIGKYGFPFGVPISSRLFGSHKTWRGFYAGYLFALIILWAQFFLQSRGIFGQIFDDSSLLLLDYQNINLFLYAFLFGIGAIFGDLIKSFFKRRLGRPPGSPWFPFDQLDLVIGALFFLLPVYVLPWENIIVLIIATPLLHILANVLAYKIGIKKVWW